MKKTLKLFTLLALVAGVSLTGCDPKDEPKGPDDKNNENNENPGDEKEPVSVSLQAPSLLEFEIDADSEPVEAPFKVQLDKAVDYEVAATLNATQDDVSPNAVCSFEVGGEATSTVVIPAGETEVEVTLVIAAYDLPNPEHSVQVSIPSVAPTEATVSGAPFTVTLTAPEEVIVEPAFKAGVFKGDGSEASTLGPYPGMNWNIVVEKFTIECWTSMSGFKNAQGAWINNQQLFNNSHNIGYEDAQTQFFVRFGPGDKTSNIMNPQNKVNAKILGTGELNFAEGLVENTWYHWAFVFDGTNVTIYQDGRDLLTRPFADSGASGTGRVAANGGVKFPTLQMICSGSQYFPNECSLTEVRFWKVARTAQEIADNMTKSIPETEYDNMVAYWPMTQATYDGTKTPAEFADVTGHGHAAILSKPAAFVKWTDDIKLSELNPAQ